MAGPEHLLADPRVLLVNSILEHVTAVLGFRGVLSRYGAELLNTPFIVNLSASTVRGEHTRKSKVSKVEAAARLGADAVAYHINISSPFENEMLTELGFIMTEADILGFPVIVLAYPRGRDAQGRDDNYLRMRQESADEYARFVRQCVRIAVEMGAAAVKTIYTGGVDSFRTVVDVACGVPVLIAGEELAPIDDVLTRARGAIDAGAAGVAFGRQVFQRTDPVSMIRSLRATLDRTWATRGSSTTRLC
jgi:DhnA family fructose-bisphosphate aldolase class Ia